MKKHRVNVKFFKLKGIQGFFCLSTKKKGKGLFIFLIQASCELHRSVVFQVGAYPSEVLKLAT